MRYLAALLTATAALCLAGAAASDTSINLTNQTWTCNQPLSHYGELPIVVNQSWTLENVVEFGVRLDRLCVGDGNPATVDLILHSDADGVVGPYGDAIRVTNASPGAHDIVVSGDAACGRGRHGNHQDGLQAIGGTDITFLHFEMKQGKFGGPSCQGAGGAAFYSSALPNVPVRMKILGGTWYGCNTGLRAGAGNGQSGHVGDAVIRNGYDKLSASCRDSDGHQYNAGPTCIFDTTPPITITHHNVICEKWPNWGLHHHH
jgi:hypothetical protein